MEQALKLRIRAAKKLLEDNGYKVTKIDIVTPEKDGLTFDLAGELYSKKVGPKDKLRKKWNMLTAAERKQAIEYIPLYVKATPDKQFRKNFETFLNQKGWLDELIPKNDNKHHTKLDAIYSIVSQHNNETQEYSTMEREIFNPFKVQDGI